MNRKTVADTELVNKLFLFAVNEYSLNNTCTVHILGSLTRKMGEGKYDHEKAVLAWHVLATRAAKLYVFRFYPEVPYYVMFNAATRRECAKWLEEYYYEDIMEGDYGKA